ncbi:MAG: diguanylate cyclase, partial [Phycisphaerae bacterium]
SWFAAVLHGVCRRSDLVARYHGDRFIVALPNSRASQATELADRCRRAMREESTTVDFRPPETTVSAGIAESTAGFIETEHQLIQRARIALDQAKRHGGDRTVSWSELLDAQPSRRALHQLTIDDVSHWVKRLRQHLRSTYVESTRALVAAVEAKDPFTQAHSLTVSTYAETIGKRMQLPVRMIETLRAAALLHDVGKIGVPDAILTKPGPLTTEEFDVIKRHPETALEILGHVSFLTDERPLILHHHERYDGTGYPTGLAGDRIPIGARILATADAVDTMFSPRSYKEPYAIDRVRAELTTGAGGQFDPTVTEVTLQWLDEAPADFPSAAVQARGSG